MDLNQAYKPNNLLLLHTCVGTKKEYTIIFYYLIVRMFMALSANGRYGIPASLVFFELWPFFA